MSGWIKLHRDILSHWISSDDKKFSAWIKILLEVNHDGKEVMVGDQILKCNRGESLNSLDKWARVLGRGWDKSKIRRFFKMLEGCRMIVSKSERITTRLTVCNYDKWQGDCNTNETQVTRKRHASDTQVTPNNNIKNENNVKNNNRGKNFVPPEINEVKAYIEENRYKIDAEYWHTFYQSKGWMVGKNKMKDWKAAVRHWALNDKKKSETTTYAPAHQKWVDPAKAQ